jgi:4-hydroxybenzoate polyprenyltransferase
MLMVARLFKALRLQESFLMTGFFMIGSVFAINDISKNSLSNLVLISLCSFLLILSIYSFNAYSGFKSDQKNRRLNGLSFISKNSFGLWSLFFFLVSFGLSLFLRKNIFLFIIIIEFVWLLYSWPRLGLKHYPFVGTLLHFFAQILHFNMVYFVFQPISIKSISLSIFFSLLFAGGHLNHEVIDYEADKNVGFKTSAVFIGLKNAIMFSFLLFASACLFWLYNYFQGYINLTYLFLFICGFIVQSVFFFLWFRSMIVNEKMRLLYRSVYRTICLLEGLFLLILKLIDLLPSTR